MSELLVTKTDLPNGTVAELYDPRVAPEIFIDGYQGFLATGSIVKMNLFSVPFSSSEGNIQRREIACRLVMGVDVFFDLVKGLQELSEKFKAETGIVIEETK